MEAELADLESLHELKQDNMMMAAQFKEEI